MRVALTLPLQRGRRRLGQHRPFWGRGLSGGGSTRLLSLPRDWPRAEGRAAIPGPSGPARLSRPFPPLPRHLAGALSTPQGPSRRSWSKVCLERPLPRFQACSLQESALLPSGPGPAPAPRGPASCWVFPPPQTNPIGT